MDNRIIEEFIATCNWAYQSYLLHVELFDNNPDPHIMQQEPFNALFSKLSAITQEYSILQITKLHDRTEQNGKENLSVNYIIDRGNWDPEIRKKLLELNSEMDIFYQKLKPARNMAISHADVGAILKGEVLGAFEKGQEKKYFDALSKFAKLVYETSHPGKVLNFKNSIKADVLAFVERFNGSK